VIIFGVRKISEKLSKILLFLLLLLIPTQLGRHFWFDWSLVLGIRIDYLSFILYLIDLIWLALFVIEIFCHGRIKNYIKNNFLNFKTLLIIGFVIVNILIAENFMVAGYKWLRIWQLIWFIWYVNKNKRLVGQFLEKIIPIWIILESFLAIGQIFKSGSLNGIWWWLGERKFSFNTIGIAQMSVIGNGLVRAYGTFSHPNSLAGFLLVSLILWWKYKGEILNKIFWWGVFWFALIAIILTGSRTIWILTLISLFWFFWNNFKEIKNKGKGIFLLSVLLVLLFKIIIFNNYFGNILSGWDENGWIKRGQLNLAAIEMIKRSPVFGVGAGNFLVNLPEFQKNNQIFWLQPVHNIFLLWISEMGFLGLGIIIWSLRFYFVHKKIDTKYLWMLGIIVLSGMVDHYWLTLPQNMWLLALVLGLI
jgi:O-antigen ligase